MFVELCLKAVTFVADDDTGRVTSINLRDFHSFTELEVA